MALEFTQQCHRARFVMNARIGDILSFIISKDIVNIYSKYGYFRAGLMWIKDMTHELLKYFLVTKYSKINTYYIEHNIHGTLVVYSDRGTYKFCINLF